MTEGGERFAVDRRPAVWYDCMYTPCTPNPC